MINTNVTPITSAMPQPSAKFSIVATLDGFPITVEIENANADKLRGMIDRLKAIGAQPPLSPTGNSQPANEDAPTCEYHGKMKRSNHGGWFCPKRMGNGEYCKSKQ